MTQQVFFRPRPDWVGDVIPYYDGGELKLYYLHECLR